MHSLAQNFCETIKTQQFPNHLIRFRKQDLLNIKAISDLGNIISKSCECEVKQQAAHFNCPSSKLSRLKIENLRKTNILNVILST